MRLLVTRPQPDAEETAARLRALGHTAIIQPLLDIVFTDPPAHVPVPGAIVLTSRNAVRAFVRWPQAGLWRDRLVFVTGPATMRTANAVGFTNVHAAAGDSVHLAEVIRTGFRPDDGTILYPAPRDRSGSLAEDLLRSGYDVCMIEAYRAEPAKQLDPQIMSDFRSRAIEGVLLYSPRTAAVFRTLVEKENLRLDTETMLFALSERVAEPLRSLTTILRVSPSPDETALLNLLPLSS